MSWQDDDEISLSLKQALMEGVVRGLDASAAKLFHECHSDPVAWPPERVTAAMQELYNSAHHILLIIDGRVAVRAVDA